MFKDMRLGLFGEICANTVNVCCDLSAVALRLSPKTCYIKPRRTINTYQTIVSPLYEFVCFPTVSLFCSLPKIERNMSTYQHAKRQKELARRTSFDPIFRRKLVQKIVLCAVLLLEVFLPTHLK